MSPSPARRRPPLKPVPAPEPPPVERSPAQLFGRRMFDLADMLLPGGERMLGDKRAFGSLMEDIAEDFTTLTEAEYYDRVRAATDLLPLTRSSARTFAEKIRAELKRTMGEGGSDVE